MNRVDDPQSELPLRREREPLFSPTHEQIRACKTQGQAMDLAVRASGLDDKEIYMDPSIDMDPGTWSKCRHDKAEFPPSLYAAFGRLTKVEVMLEWLCWQQGRTSVVIQSEAERMAEEAIARARKAEDKVEILEDILSKALGARQP
jgi:hypothetical protein